MTVHRAGVPTAVEVCLRKKRRGLPQNLIGPPELTDLTELTFQLLHPGPLFGAQTRASSDVALTWRTQ